jgi:hypothetical protein
MAKSLRLVDQDGNVWLEWNHLDASCLASSLFYAVDYRPEEYPEYDELMHAIYGWMGSLAES